MQQLLITSLPSNNYLVFNDGDKAILEITNMDSKLIKISLRGVESKYQIKARPNFNANLFSGVPGEGAESVPFRPNVPATLGAVIGTSVKHDMYITDFSDLPKIGCKIEFEIEKAIG